jgi:serine phosphatase RsbU (regulator of sigma subunit)
VPITSRCPPGTGVVGDPVLEDAVTALQPGEAVLFYTDGLTEAAAPARTLTWEDVGRLAGPMLPGTSAEELVTRLERAALELSGGEPRDDVALLVAVVEP